MTDTHDPGLVADVRRHITYKRDGERSLDPVLADHMLAALDGGAAPDYQGLLRAASWPAPPRLVFHTADRAARDQITTDGLRVSQPGADGTDAWADPDGVWAGQVPGVYVGQALDVIGRWSRWEHWDVWQVETTGLEWAPDLLNPRCWVLADAVPVGRLQLVTP